MGEPLVDLCLVHPHILLDIRYATENNFLGRKLYSQPKAFLRKTVAEKIGRVQDKLEKKGLGLKIWDAYRPLSVQESLWKVVPDERYVADPKKGSSHNRGAAVDLTLVTSALVELTMPTPFDDFTEQAHSDAANLPSECIENRELLKEVMVSEGFVPLPTEWWHFDDEHALSYDLLSIPFEELG